PVVESGLAEELDGGVGKLEDDLTRRVRTVPQPVDLVHKRAELVVSVELLEVLLDRHCNLDDLLPYPSRLGIFGGLAIREDVAKRMDVLVVDLAAIADQSD